jgi:hypothetical protein
LSHVYCPECGFQNPEAANYCAKCGARLIPESPGEATESFTPDDLDDSGALERSGVGGPALVVRSGGGRAGETFFPTPGTVSLVGRSPECDIFLDDVTVSRKHAELSNTSERWTIRDLGSLNGTFVNRKRIESADLEDDDEVQIGKYRLTFLLR